MPEGIIILKALADDRMRFEGCIQLYILGHFEFATLDDMNTCLGRACQALGILLTERDVRG